MRSERNSPLCNTGKDRGKEAICRRQNSFSIQTLRGDNVLSSHQTEHCAEYFRVPLINEIFFIITWFSLIHTS